MTTNDNGVEKCPDKIISEYKDKTKGDVKTANTGNKQGKRESSQEIGEEAAICANRLMENNPGKEGSHYQIFSGKSVFDLVYIEEDKNGNTTKVQIKEAKGGNSQYGYIQNKTIRQCTPKYVEATAKKMSNSNYKGKKSTVPCEEHQSNGVDPKCKNCMGEEAKRRQEIGNKITDAMAKGTLEKIGVRGQYDEEDAKPPEILTYWRINEESQLEFCCRKKDGKDIFKNISTETGTVWSSKKDEDF